MANESLQLPMGTTSSLMATDDMIESFDHEIAALTEPMLEESDPTELVRSRMIRFARFNKRKLLLFLFSGVVLSGFVGAMVSIRRNDHRKSPSDDHNGSQDPATSEDDDIYSGDDDYASGYATDDDPSRHDDRRGSIEDDDFLQDDDSIIFKSQQADDLRLQSLVSILKEHGIVVPERKAGSEAPLPQSRAIDWLVIEDPANLDFHKTPIMELLERYATVVLFFATDGSKWTFNDGFLQDSSICNWSTSRMTNSKNGVYCSKSQPTVTHLIINDHNLNGTIPTEVSLFTNLKMLSLGGNVLRGSVPSDLAKLSMLHVLDLSFNSLTGRFPLEIFQLPLLDVVHIEGNNLDNPAQLK